MATRLRDRNAQHGHGRADGGAPAFVRGMRLLEEAYRFAATAHAGQRDETGGAFLEHPLAVARLLHEAGFAEPVVAAGLLHDVIEHSDADMPALRRRFPASVAELVEAMTEPAGVEPFEAQKAAHREQVAAAGRDAEAIFAADKIVKASSLRAAIADRGGDEVDAHLSNPLDKKVEHYEATLELLEQVAEDLEILPQLREQLDELDAELTHDKTARRRR